jgi:hypothetical protein
VSPRLALGLLCLSCAPKRAHVDVGEARHLHVTFAGAERAVPLVQRALLEEAGNTFTLTFEKDSQPVELELHVKIAHAVTRAVVDRYGKGSHAGALTLVVTMTNNDGDVLLDKEKFPATGKSHATADAAISAAAHQAAEELFDVIAPVAR